MEDPCALCRDDLMLRFLVLHSYRLAFCPARLTKLGPQLLRVWKAASATFYFKRRVGVFFIREFAAAVIK
jgi:hypothetical protein